MWFVGAIEWHGFKPGVLVQLSGYTGN